MRKPIIMAALLGTLLLSSAAPPRLALKALASSLAQMLAPLAAQLLLLAACSPAS